MVEVEVGGARSLHSISYVVPLELDCRGKDAVIPRDNTSAEGIQGNILDGSTVEHSTEIESEDGNLAAGSH